MADTNHNTPYIEPRLRYKPGAVDLGRPATFEDLDTYPEGLAVELIDGLMEVQPQPTNRHRFLQSRLNLMLNATFDDGVGKLGGWLIMFEPEIRLESRSLVPDVAGWRKERAAHFSEVAHADVAPDWLCEILSPSTAKRDRTIKMDQYAAWGVGHMWIIDPEPRTLESYRLADDRWLLIKTYDDKGSVYIEPFLDGELDLNELWNLPFKKQESPESRKPRIMPDTEHDLSPADVGLNADRLDHIPDYFEKAYIKDGKLPCMATMVSRNGQIVHEAYRGQTEFGGKTAIGADTIFRIYSMTKPITSVAAMMLHDEGILRLDHEIARYIPEFANTEVWVGGDLLNYETRKPDRPMTVRDAFTHTTGVTYGFLMQHEVDALYRREKIGLLGEGEGETLGQMCARIAKLPLLFSPGTQWNYGHSTDLLGRVVEVASGMSLDQFFRERIFEPLGMVDTDFFVPESKLDRLATCYAKNPITGEVSVSDPGGKATKAYAAQPKLLNAGGGLVSTLRDYHNFCLMLLQGGSLNGHRLLSPKTVEFMRMNHLPDGKTIKEMGDKTFSEARMEGNGFGLGGSTIVNVADTLTPGSLGSFSWGGLANTFFWVDWEEELIAIQATQMIPTGCYPIRPQFQQLVYAAIDW